MAKIDLNYKFLKIEEMAKDVAEQALDNFLYDGKSIREWMQIIASEDAVSKQAVLDVLDKNKYSNEFCKEHNIDWSINLGMAYIVVNELKPITPQSKTGRWIEEIDDYGKVIGWHCDRCYEDSGFTTDCKWGFCPNCGAMMQTDKEI